MAIMKGLKLNGGKISPARPALGNSMGQLGWIRQPKANGVRCILQIEGGGIKGWTRTGISIDTSSLKAGQDVTCTLDGELCVLQNGDIVFYVFDILATTSSLLGVDTSQRIHHLNLLLERSELDGIESIHNVYTYLIEGEVWKNPTSWYPQGKTKRWVKRLYR